MGLLTSISSTNRVVEQGDTYEFYSEPAVSETVVARTESGSSDVYYDKAVVTQWHGVAHFSKRYKYVGLEKSSAESAAASILAAYTKSVDKWAISLVSETVNGVTSTSYKYAVVGSTAMSCAAVSPVHAEGAMWSVEVDVDATIDGYYSSNSAPSDSTLKGLITALGIHNFPESS